LRAVLRTILVTALAVALLAVFLRNADLARVWTEMQAARLDLLGVALVMTVVMYFIRAERWQYLLEPLGHTRFRVAFETTIIGFATSFVLPARAGELLRPYLLARHERLPATAVFATIIVERMLDLIAVLILLGLYLAGFSNGASDRAPRLYQAVAVGGAVMVPVGLAVLAAMFLMAGHPERVHALVLQMERVLPARLAHRIASLARTFSDGLAVVRRPLRLVAALAWSMALWLAIAAQTWVIAHAFGIVLPFVGSFVVTAMLVVGVALPTPGGVGGTHEAFRLGVTSFYGADNNAAIGAAILQHAVNFVPITVLGLWFIVREGLNFGRLRELSASARQASATHSASRRAFVDARDEVIS
jgi:uncharacterized protein (TIRG00374 family)